MLAPQLCWHPDCTGISNVLAHQLYWNLHCTGNPTLLATSVADRKQKFRIRLRIRIRPQVSFGSGSGFGSGFESGFESRIRIRIRILDQDLDQKLAKFFFVLKFLRSLIFKAALHQLCDLATNKVRKKLAISEDLNHTYMHIVCV